MRTINAEVNGNCITCLVFEYYPDGGVKVLDEAFFPRIDMGPKFTKLDEQLVRGEYPNLPPETKLFVCAT